MEQFNRLQLPLVVLDQTNGQILHSSQGFIEYLNLRHKSPCGQKLADLIKQESRELLDDFLHNSNKQDVHLLFQKQHGQTSNGHLYKIPSTSKNGTLTVVIFDHDLENLLESEKEAAIRILTNQSHLAELGHYAASLAHDLNNPIGIISGYLENIIERSEPISSAELMLSVKEMQKAIDRIQKIVNSIHGFAIPDEATNSPGCDLSKLVYDLFEITQKEFSHRNLALHLSTHGDGLVATNPKLLHQLVLTLLNEILEKTERGEDPSNIHLDVDCSDYDWAYIKIDYPGAPLLQHPEEGLARHERIAQLVKTIGAKLLTEYSPEVNVSSIYLRLPRHIVRKNLKPDAPRVLVVDDEEAFRQLLSIKLRNKGFEVVQAQSGQEALECLQHEKVDGIFTDIRMPGLNGERFIEIVRKRHPKLPVIAVSGYPHLSMQMLKADELSAHGFVSKPINQKVFEEAIRLVLQWNENLAA